jgi:hypothetical protein
MRDSESLDRYRAHEHLSCWFIFEFQVSVLFANLIEAHAPPDS